METRITGLIVCELVFVFLVCTRLELVDSFKLKGEVDWRSTRSAVVDLLIPQRNWQIGASNSHHLNLQRLSNRRLLPGIRDLQNAGSSAPAPSPQPDAGSPTPSPIGEPPKQDRTNPALENPQSPPSEPTFNPSTNLTSTDSNQHVAPWVVYVPVICGSVVLISIALIYFMFFQKKKVQAVMPWATGLSGQLRKAFVTGVPALQRPELETACENFSNVIGTLSDCKLYKGTLSSSIEIAVVSTKATTAAEWSRQSDELFRNKISVLSKVNHKNFMNLIGYCMADEPFTRMMVHEYAPCGTLFEHLHIREAENLDWAARLRVVMGISYCLEHLEQLNPPVVLHNLNSSSIYLTEDYAAKVSDIGFLSEEKPLVHDEENPLQESVVYKFGIILLEVISGRLPFSEDDGLLVLWASSYLTGKRPLVNMVDPTLKSVPEKDLIALSEVIRLCINANKGNRLTMTEVAAQLKSITSITPQVATPRDNPLWWAELEIANSEGSDSQRLM